jgi:hypothetical protein
MSSAAGKSTASSGRIGERTGKREQRGRYSRHAQLPREPEDAAGDDGEMEARNHEHVKGAGALEADAQILVEVSAVAGHHGGEHGGVIRAEAQHGRQALHSGR